MSQDATRHTLEELCTIHDRAIEMLSALRSYREVIQGELVRELSPNLMVYIRVGEYHISLGKVLEPHRDGPGFIHTSGWPLATVGAALELINSAWRDVDDLLRLKDANFTVDEKTQNTNLAKFAREGTFGFVSGRETRYPVLQDKTLRRLIEGVRVLHEALPSPQGDIASHEDRQHDIEGADDGLETPPDGNRWRFEPGRAIFDGRPYDVTPKPLKALQLFIKSRRTVLGYADLREALDEGYDLSKDTIRSHLSSLRSTLKSVAEDAGYADDIGDDPLPNKNGGWELKLPRP